MPFSAAANASSAVLTGRQQTITPADTSLTSDRFAINLTVADLALNSVGAIGLLPARSIPLFLEIDATRMDNGATPTLAFSLGIVNDAETAISTLAADGGAAWFTGRTEGRLAGLTVSGLLTSAALRSVQGSQTQDRKLGIHVTAAAATPAAGVLAVTLYYRMI